MLYTSKYSNPAHSIIYLCIPVTKELCSYSLDERVDCALNLRTSIYTDVPPNPKISRSWLRPLLRFHIREDSYVFTEYSVPCIGECIDKCMLCMHYNYTQAEEVRWTNSTTPHLKIQDILEGRSLDTKGMFSFKDILDDYIVSFCKLYMFLDVFTPYRGSTTLP